MAFWIVLGLALIFIGIIGLTRVHPARVNVLESIEKPEEVRAYDHISKWPQFKFIRRMIVRELSRYHPAGVLVDAGCGPGYLIAVIARTFPDLRIIGSDISGEMLKSAAQNLASQGYGDRVSFRQGNVQSLPFEDSSIDFLTSTLSLHHWRDPGKAFREVQRVLKPGGQFLVFDLRRDCRRFFYWLVWFAQHFVVPRAMSATREPIGSVLAAYTPTELDSFVAGLGLREHRIKSGMGWMYLWGQKA